MSSLVIKVLLLCLVSSLATFAAIDKSPSSGAATVVLSINAETLRVASKGLCAASAKVKVDFDKTSYPNITEFRALRKMASGNTPTSCPSKIQDNQSGVVEFSASNPLVDGSYLLGEKLCQGENSKGQKGNAVLCIYPGNDYVEENLLAQAMYNFDTFEAAIEEIFGKMALNGKIIFSIRTKDATENIKVETCYGKVILGDITGKDCLAPFSSKTTDGETVKISGLDNNDQYVFKIRLIMPGGKYGEWRGNYYATPIPAAFALDLYNGNGAYVGWNCQSSRSDFSLFLLFLVLVIFMGRKFFMSLLKNNLFLVLTLSFALSSLFPKESFAYSSNYSFGILGSMYRPDLDSEKVNGKNIFPFYKTIFRRELKEQDGPINPLIGAEFDWNFFNGFGTAQLGIGAGYTFVSGHPVVIEAGKPQPSKPISNAFSSLHMYQIRPQLTYLFDYFVDTFPIFPYVRGSLIAHGFSFRDLGEQPEALGIKKANGFRFGYQVGAGLMLKLDFLEPSAVADARSSGDFQHIYLKSDLSYSQIDDFHQPGYVFSAKDVMGTSLPLLWTFGLVFAI